MRALAVVRAVVAKTISNAEADKELAADNVTCARTSTVGAADSVVPLLSGAAAGTIRSGAAVRLLVALRTAAPVTIAPPPCACVGSWVVSAPALRAGSLV